MLQALTRPNRGLTIALLVLCSGLAIAAALVGVSDNPPGLLLGLLAGVAAVTAFVHPWRNADDFWHLAFYSVLSLVLIGMLHIAFDILAHPPTGTFPKYFFGPLAASTFLVALLVCPAAFLVGIIGALIALIASRRHLRGSAV